MKRILFVDDEKYILRNIKKLLKNEPYESLIASSGKEALEILSKETVDVIVADSRMPQMDGAALLEEVKAKYPKIIRVALCGFTESRIIQKLVEKNVAKLYLFKPWDDYEFKLNLNGILDMKYMMMNQYLLDLIDKLEALPSLPKIYYDISELIDRGADISEVSKIVEKDQAIASKVLKLANSAFYGRKTGDLNQAIMGIGLNNLKNIVLSTSLFSGPQELMNEIEVLWQHAVNTNRLTHMIYDQLLDKKMPSIYGSAGLLHDIGKLILHLFYQNTYQKVLDHARNMERSLVECEMEYFNITHQDLGAYLLNWWELPYAYVEAAMFHHRPSDSRVINYELVAVTHLSNYYSIMEISPDETQNYLDPTVFTKLNIEKEEVDRLVASLKNTEHSS
ncbi:MAG: HDOD domain-containing protein [Clostridia bacterium]|nr:HDOD domain-containing protein [Clostridia bacterium]